MFIFPERKIRPNIMSHLLILAVLAALIALLMVSHSAFSHEAQAEPDMERPVVNSLTAELRISGENATAIVSGKVHDLPEDGNASGADYVFLYNNGESVNNSTGQPMKIRIEGDEFNATLPLSPVSTEVEDISYFFTARAFDRADNAGNLSEPAVWNCTGRAERLWLIQQDVSNDISIHDEAPVKNENRNEIEDIKITFSGIQSGQKIYPVFIRYKELENQSDAVGMGLPEGYDIFCGTYVVESTPEFRNLSFEASIIMRVRLNNQTYFSLNKYHPLDNIRIVSRTEGGGEWKMRELQHGRPFPVDSIRHIYRLEIMEHSLSEYAVIIAKPDLTIKHLELSPYLDKLNVREELNISVTVGNGGVFPAEAEDVKVSFYLVREGEDPRFLDTLNLGSISPNADYYSSDPGIGRGAKICTLFSDYLRILDPETLEPYSIMVIVDPANEIDEYSEGNNTARVPLTDASPPEIEVPQEYNNKVVKGNLWLTGNASDDTYVLRVVYRIDGKGEWSKAYGDIKWDIGINTKKLSNGRHTIKFRAYDGKNYSPIRNITVEVKNESEGGMGNAAAFLITSVFVILIIGAVVFWSEEILSRTRTLISGARMKLNAVRGMELNKETGMEKDDEAEMGGVEDGKEVLDNETDE